jgi:hypothetical protein
MNKPREVIDADGSRWIGDGPTYLVFSKSGNVALMLHGEKAEHRALTKNFTPEVTASGTTLMIDELLFNGDGVPPYSERLVSLVHSIVYDVRSEQEAKKVLKQFSSVVIAARRLAHEPLGKSAHERFRVTVIHLAKQSGRAPTRSEIREAMWSASDKFKIDTREVTRLCDENGLSWLPTGRPGRKKKTPKKPQKRYNL